MTGEARPGAMPEWAAAVARAFVEYHRTYRWGAFAPFPIDECWVGADLALYLRYRPVSLRLGRRVADLHLDVTGSGGPPADAADQARYVFHDLYGPPPPRWTDPRGYAWSGPDPRTATWADAVGRTPRLVTVVPGVNRLPDARLR